MIAELYASRFDLPFYLRLPSSVFLTWDPNDSIAAVLPRQRLGEVSFSRTTSLVQEATLLDAPAPPPYGAPAHLVVMTCETRDGRTVPTLRVDTSVAGGCAEVRPYTEITVFVSDAVRRGEQRTRTFRILNHFLDLYRLVTQDPWVVPIDPELDVYLIDSAVAAVPEEHRNQTCEEILGQLSSLHFATDIGAERHHQYRLNTLEDLFPGSVLERAFLATFAQTIRSAYEMPLHYDLLLLAQSQLKHRSYRFAVLEAETAFEAYVSDMLIRIKIASGGQRDGVVRQVEDLRGLSARLRELDVVATQWRTTRSAPAWSAFVGSAPHREWKESLYVLRNRVVHEGYRGVTFDEAKRGIGAAKLAMRHLETELSDLANPIQIYTGVEFLQNTAGRLHF